MMTETRVPGDVSVVIAAHDTRRWTALNAALDSVEAQTEPPLAVVVAVDHNADLEARLRQSRPGITVVTNSEVRGASAARNAGVEAVDTEFVAFLDDDEIAEPHWLKDLLVSFADPRVVGTGGQYVPSWESARPSWFPDELAWVVGAHHSGMPTTAAVVRNVWSGNMAVRSETFRSVGGFRAGFGKVGSRSRPEDTDLCIRMAAAVPEGRWIYLPDARIHHWVPQHRSTFAFYVRRCYAEGRGKIDLREAHADTSGTLDTEVEYLRRTIPAGLRRNLLEASASAARAGAIMMGVGAAGVGAAVSTAASRRRRVRA